MIYQLKTGKTESCVRKHKFLCFLSSSFVLSILTFSLHVLILLLCNVRKTILLFSYFPILHHGQQGTLLPFNKLLINLKTNKKKKKRFPPTISLIPARNDRYARKEENNTPWLSSFCICNSRRPDQIRSYD